MDRQNRREFLRKGAAAGAIVAGLPLVRSFDVPAFGQAGSPPVPPPSGDVPEGGPVPGQQPGAADLTSSGGHDPGAAVAGEQVAGGSLPFTGGDPKNLAVAGAGAVVLGTVMVGRPRHTVLGHGTDVRTARSLARLDKVFWGFESPPLSVLGFSFRVRHTEAPIGPALLALLAPFRTPEDGPAGPAAPDAGDQPLDLSVRDRGERRDPRFAIYRDGRLLTTAGEPWSALSALFGALDRATVERATARGLVLHAAAAGVGDRVAMLVGPSGSGKTTLTTALVRDGLGYVADEVVAVDADTLRIAPYHKPLTIKPGSHHVFPELRRVGVAAHGATHAHWHVPATSIRRDALAAGGTTGCVIGVEHRAGTASALERLDEADAMSLLVQQCFNGERLDQRGLDTAVRLARDVPCYRLHYSDTDTACALVRRALANVGSGTTA
jgi:hypothetical protein